MIRPLTCLCVLAAAGAGLYLYQTKHRTLLLDQQISSVLQQAEDARARTVVLRAEYALLNQPDRLAALSGRYLDLKPLVPTQFVQPAGLERHLPPVQVFAASGDDAGAAPSSPLVPSPAPSPAATADTDADAPAVVPGPAIDVAPHGNVDGAAAPQGAAAKPVRRVVAASASPVGRTRAPAALATSRPVVAAASLRPGIAGRAPVTVAAYRPSAPPMRRYGSGDMGGSMLGGATEAMAPPVPVAN